MITIINKIIRVTNKTTAVIDHILTNSYPETIFKTAILKSDVSDHVSICVISEIFIEESRYLYS